MILMSNLHAWEFVYSHQGTFSHNKPGLDLYTPVRPDGDQKMYKVAGKREHNARKSLKNTNLNKAVFLLRSYCDLCDQTTFSRRAHHDLSAFMAFLLRSMGSATAITGDPAAHDDLRAFLPRSHGDYLLSRSDFSEISRGSLCSHTAQ